MQIIDPLEEYADMIQETPFKKPVPLTPREFRELAQSFDILGVRVRVELSDTLATAYFRHGRHESDAQFSTTPYPLESAARTMFEVAAEQARQKDTIK